jgi:hypothetical protein
MCGQTRGLECWRCLLGNYWSRSPQGACCAWDQAGNRQHPLHEPGTRFTGWVHSPPTITCRKVGCQRITLTRLLPRRASCPALPTLPAAGHAGVFCTAALCFNSALHYEERRGRLHLAAGWDQPSTAQHNTARQAASPCSSPRHVVLAVQPAAGHCAAHKPGGSLCNALKACEASVRSGSMGAYQVPTWSLPAWQDCVRR